MKKDTCAGWKYSPHWDHVIDKNNNGDAIGCHISDGSQSWYCSECRHKDSGACPDLSEVQQGIEAERRGRGGDGDEVF